MYSRESGGLFVIRTKRLSEVTNLTEPVCGAFPQAPVIPVTADVISFWRRMIAESDGTCLRKRAA